MPAKSYVFDGIVYDTDGTTALASANINVLDVKTGESVKEVTNSSGQYSLDLNTLPSSFTNGDLIIVSAFKSSENGYEVVRKYTEYATTINTVNPGESVNLYVMLGERGWDNAKTSCYIKSVTVYNGHTGTIILNFYERKTGELKLKVSCVTVATANFVLATSGLGVVMNEGYSVVPSINTANTGKIVLNVVRA